MDIIFGNLNMIESIELRGGKYTFLSNDDPNNYYFKCLRHGDEWRSFVGDKAIKALFDRCKELENQELNKITIMQQPEYVEYGCVTQRKCMKCSIKIECDNEKVGIRTDNVEYVSGPCCCHSWYCSLCIRR